MGGRQGQDRRKVVIDWVPVDNLTMEEAIEATNRCVDERKGLLIVTPNMDHLYRLRRDEEFRRVYASAGLILADGLSLIWLARAQGTPLKEKVSGVDFLVEYCRAAAQCERRVFFIGGGGDVAQRSAEALGRVYPGLNVVGTYAPPTGFESNADETRTIIEKVKRGRPDVLFVAAGTPKQEKWLLQNWSKLGPIVAVGVGAAFDFVSGRIARAPRWMQNCGLEWAWRLAHEPRRLFRRYVIEDLPLFLCLLVKCLGRRIRGANGRSRVEREPPAVGAGRDSKDSAGTD